MVEKTKPVEGRKRERYEGVKEMERDGFRYREANRAKSIINQDKFIVINNERVIDTTGKHKHL